MSKEDMKCWPVLNFLELSSPLNISMVYVFGLGKEALIATHDGKVYGLGTNDCGCLGIGQTGSTTTPIEIQELSGIPIKTFAAGSSPHVLALTTRGTVFGWGSNHNGQLGLSSNVSSVNIPVEINDLKTVGDIKEIACGHSNSVVLTNHGKIYVTVKRDKNSKYWAALKISEIEFISCEFDDIIMVSNSNIFSIWNEKGFTQIDLDFKMEKVVSGQNHSLFLTWDMNVFSCGKNSFGQLGIPDSEGDLTMEKVTFPRKAKIVDIAASHVANISIALDINNIVFIWGLCTGQIIPAPLACEASSLHNAMAIFGGAICMHAPLCIPDLGKSEENNLLESIKFSFDDPNSCDLILQVEEKDIHVHANVLRMRSIYLQTLLKDCWRKPDQGKIKIEGFSYDIYRTLLWYLHSDQCVLNTPMEALSLYEAADVHILPGLKNRCAQYFKAKLDVANVLKMYVITAEKNLKELLDRSLDFILANATDVVTSSGFTEFPSEYAKDILCVIAEKKMLTT